MKKEREEKREREEHKNLGGCVGPIIALHFVIDSLPSKTMAISGPLKTIKVEKERRKRRWKEKERRKDLDMYPQSLLKKNFPWCSA